MRAKADVVTVQGSIPGPLGYGHPLAALCPMEREIKKEKRKRKCSEAFRLLEFKKKKIMRNLKNFKSYFLGKFTNFKMAREF